jgi:hypothetical protein
MSADLQIIGHILESKLNSKIMNDIDSVVMSYTPAELIEAIDAYKEIEREEIEEESKNCGYPQD